MVEDADDNLDQQLRQQASRMSSSLNLALAEQIRVFQEKLRAGHRAARSRIHDPHCGLLRRSARHVPDHLSSQVENSFGLRVTASMRPWAINAPFSMP
jgi:hypothetical protein